MRKIVSLTGLIVLFYCSSCNPSTTQGNDVELVSNDTVISKNDTSKGTEDFFYSLPSPLIMARVFKRTGLKYVDGITNSPDHISKYTSIQSKTLNLGVYSADLAYSLLNKQTELASKYMGSVKRLADDLGMSSLFDAEDYLNRFKTNLNHEDSLINVVSELKGEMDIFMKDNDQERQTLLIFVGAWVENMYIATQLTKDINKTKIAQRVAEQKYILNTLLNIVSKLHNDNELDNFLLKLNGLKMLFDNLVVNNEDKIVIDELELKAITEKTKDLREEIVG